MTGKRPRRRSFPHYHLSCVHLLLGESTSDFYILLFFKYSFLLGEWKNVVLNAPLIIITRLLFMSATERVSCNSVHAQWSWTTSLLAD